MDGEHIERKDLLVSDGCGSGRADARYGKRIERKELVVSDGCGSSRADAPLIGYGVMLEQVICIRSLNA